MQSSGAALDAVLSTTGVSPSCTTLPLGSPSASHEEALCTTPSFALLHIAVDSFRVVMNRREVKAESDHEKNNDTTSREKGGGEGEKMENGWAPSSSYYSLRGTLRDQPFCTTWGVCGKDSDQDEKKNNTAHRCLTDTFVIDWPQANGRRHDGGKEGKEGEEEKDANSVEAFLTVPFSPSRKNRTKETTQEGCEDSLRFPAEGKSSPIPVLSRDTDGDRALPFPHDRLLADILSSWREQREQQLVALLASNTMPKEVASEAILQKTDGVPAGRHEKRKEKERAVDLPWRGKDQNNTWNVSPDRPPVSPPPLVVAREGGVATSSLDRCDGSTNPTSATRQRHEATVEENERCESVDCFNPFHHSTFSVDVYATEEVTEGGGREGEPTKEEVWVGWAEVQLETLLAAVCAHGVFLPLPHDPTTIPHVTDGEQDRKATTVQLTLVRPPRRDRPSCASDVSTVERCSPSSSSSVTTTITTTTLPASTITGRNTWSTGEKKEKTEASDVATVVGTLYCRVHCRAQPFHSAMRLCQIQITPNPLAALPPTFLPREHRKKIHRSSSSMAFARVEEEEEEEEENHTQRVGGRQSAASAILPSSSSPFRTGRSTCGDRTPVRDHGRPRSSLHEARRMAEMPKSVSIAVRPVARLSHSSHSTATGEANRCVAPAVPSRPSSTLALTITPRCPTTVRHWTGTAAGPPRDVPSGMASALPSPWGVTETSWEKERREAWERTTPKAYVPPLPPVVASPCAASTPAHGGWEGLPQAVDAGGPHLASPLLFPFSLTAEEALWRLAPALPTPGAAVGHPLRGATPPEACPPLFFPSASGVAAHRSHRALGEEKGMDLSNRNAEGKESTAMTRGVQPPDGQRMGGYIARHDPASLEKDDTRHLSSSWPQAKGSTTTTTTTLGPQKETTVGLLHDAPEEDDGWVSFVTSPTQQAYVQTMLSPLWGSGAAGHSTTAMAHSISLEGIELSHGTPQDGIRRERSTSRAGEDGGPHREWRAGVGKEREGLLQDVSASPSCLREGPPWRREGGSGDEDVAERERKAAVAAEAERLGMVRWEATSMRSPFPTGAVMWKGTLHVQQVGREPAEEEEEGEAMRTAYRSLSPTPLPPLAYRKGHREDGPYAASSLAPSRRDSRTVLGHFDITWPPVWCRAYVCGKGGGPPPCHSLPPSFSTAPPLSTDANGREKWFSMTEEVEEGPYLYMDAMMECPLHFTLDREREQSAGSSSPSPSVSGSASFLRRRSSVLDASTMTIDPCRPPSLPHPVETSVNKRGAKRPTTTPFQKAPPLRSSAPAVRLAKGWSHVSSPNNARDASPAPSSSPLPSWTVTARVTLRFLADAVALSFPSPMTWSPDGPSSLPCTPPRSLDHPSSSPTDLTAVEEADWQMVETFFRGELQLMQQWRSVMEDEYHALLLLSSSSGAEEEEEIDDRTVEELPHHVAEQEANREEEVSSVAYGKSTSEGAPMEAKGSIDDESEDCGGMKDDSDSPQKENSQRHSLTFWGDSILHDIRETQRRIEKELEDGEAFLKKKEEEERQSMATADSRILALQNDLKAKEEELDIQETVKRALVEDTHQRQRQYKAVEKELMEYIAAEMHRYAIRLQAVRSKE